MFFYDTERYALTGSCLFGRIGRRRHPCGDVCRVFWTHYEDELKASGDILYTWQYDIRWAATDLRKSGIMKDAADCPKGIWSLA